MKLVKQTAKEYHEIDGTSYSYRYPVNKQGEESTSHHQVVNMRSLCTTMEDILTQLETINFGLEIESDIAQKAYEVLSNI